MFKNFEILTPADRTMIYLTLYLQQLLKEVATGKVKDKKDAKTAFYQLAIKNFTVPGDSGWTLGGMFPQPAGREEADSFKMWMKQARTELSERVLEIFFNADNSVNKWWVCFGKKKFMGKELS